MGAQDNLNQEQFFDQQQDRALDETRTLAGREHWNDNSNVHTDLNKSVREHKASKKPRHHMHRPKGKHHNPAPKKNGE